MISLLQLISLFFVAEKRSFTCQSESASKANHHHLVLYSKSIDFVREMYQWGYRGQGNIAWPCPMISDAWFWWGCCIHHHQSLLIHCRTEASPNILHLSLSHASVLHPAPENALSPSLHLVLCCIWLLQFLGCHSVTLVVHLLSVLRMARPAKAHFFFLFSASSKYLQP